MNYVKTSRNQPNWSTARILSVVSLIIASAALAYGYFSVNRWMIASGILLIALIWYAAVQLNWSWVPSAIFLLFFLAAGTGFLFGIDAVWLVSSALFALCAWDLEALATRFDKAGKIITETSLTSRHLLRLILTEGSGLVLVFIALSAHIKFGFGMQVVLAIIAVLGFSYAIKYLIRATR
jgi:hypothetical protein